MPAIEKVFVIPDDLRTFYKLAGGASLFANETYGVNISTPSELVPANPVLIGCQVPEDITASWFLIAHDDNGDYLTIDLHPSRLGRCYDSFWDTHGVRGSCPIIAHSFTELLRRLFDNAGGHRYWLQPTWQSLGDAYDDDQT